MEAKWLEYYLLSLNLLLAFLEYILIFLEAFLQGHDPEICYMLRDLVCRSKVFVASAYLRDHVFIYLSYFLKIDVFQVFECRKSLFQFFSDRDFSE